jgi:hypothetical protein
MGKGLIQPPWLDGDYEDCPRCSQNVHITKNEVFVERAAPLTQEGIKAVCGTDEKYTEYVKTLNLNNSSTAQKNIKKTKQEICEGN